ncbi:hypothetical protein KORDIASMS9_01017 [Kordia sp. SMS9]|nr:hypothetical protein KORDIASMS9_01017 [Kordia sp. SMS9]
MTKRSIFKVELVFTSNRLPRVFSKYSQGRIKQIDKFTAVRNPLKFKRKAILKKLVVFEEKAQLHYQQQNHRDDLYMHNLG